MEKSGEQALFETALATGTSYLRLVDPPPPETEIPVERETKSLLEIRRERSRDGRPDPAIGEL